MASKLKLLVVSGVTVAVGAGLTSHYLLKEQKEFRWMTVKAQQDYNCTQLKDLPSRQEQIESLQNDCFDVIVIGGGATGASCALDAATRGLRTALIEHDDFASGTSSKSTKLIHGGVRYLQKAVMGLDYEQYKMVKEALSERKNLLNVAPHLSRALPIMLPIYHWWQLPYMWIGIKMYDLVAGFKTIKSSYLISKKTTLEIFPLLKEEGLTAAIVYYDGQMNDARMNLAIALTAAKHGATIANHVSVTGLIKEKCSNGKERLCGVHVKDELTGKEWKFRGKCIINATGPYTDTIRQMDDESTRNICSQSAGTHIVLPGYYCPDQMGLLDPATSDGRVIFFLPWQKHTICGTTDIACELTHHPAPTEDEIEFLLSEIRNYINTNVEVHRSDVLSAWSGIRPLITDPNKKDTQSLARNHIILVSDSKLITIAGGKWTTCRLMAEETIDEAIKACNLKPTFIKSQTKDLLLEGAEGWNPNEHVHLVQEFGIEHDVAEHLSNSYGNQAAHIARMASLTGKRWPIRGKKLHPDFPFIEAEVKYGVCEYAMTAVDMIGRRMPMAFLNAQAAKEALPTIVEIMGRELHWSEGEMKRQQKEAHDFLQIEMGLLMNIKTPQNLNEEEIQIHIKRFLLIDKNGDGYISTNDIKRSLEQQGQDIFEMQEIKRILNGFHSSTNGQVNIEKYLEIVSAIKSKHNLYSPFLQIEDFENHKRKPRNFNKRISVERSGGGL